MEIKEILKSEESRKNFLIGLVFLSKIDGNVDEREKAFFQSAANALDLHEKSLEEVNLSWNESIMPEIKFNDKKESLFFLTQAIQLSSVDNAYSDKEKEFVHSISKDLGVSNSSLEAIENWVYEGIQWQTKGEKLLELED